MKTDNRISQFIRETGGIPGGIEEGLLIDFYKNNGRLPGELSPKAELTAKIAFCCYGVGILSLFLEGFIQVIRRLI